MRIVAILNKFSDGVGKVISLLILPIAFIMVAEVLSRGLLNHPLIWTYEISLFLYGGYVVLLGGYAIYHESHVRMDLFYHHFSPKTKAIADMATSLLFFAFIILMLWFGSEWTWEAWKWNEHSQSQWGPWLFPVKLTIPLAALLLLIAGIAKFIQNLSLVIRGEEGREQWTP